MHEGSAHESLEESIPNDAFSKMKIKAKLESGISPSALSKYLQCPLDFYYRYVLGLGEVKDMEEELDAASIGSAVHRVLEKWMEPLAKNQEKITAEHIAIWKAQLQSAVIQAMQEGDQDFEKSGFNLLAFEAVCKMVERVIQYEGQQLTAGIHSKLIAVEAGLNYKLQSNQDYTIHLIGKIDRIHQQNDQWIVLDYKTGKVKKDDLSTKHGLSKEFVAGGKKSKLMQVLIYAFLVNQCYGIPVESIEAGLFPLAAKENMPLFIANKELFPADFKEKMEEILLHIANEMIERPDFTHNPQASHCQFCRDRAV
jgi:RecB family exonuclease